jgi:hypothetical protein
MAAPAEVGRAMAAPAAATVPRRAAAALAAELAAPAVVRHPLVPAVGSSAVRDAAVVVSAAEP